MFIKSIFIILVIAAFNSCSTQRPEGKTEAEVLFQEATALREDGRYLMAIEKLNIIRSKFPYSYYATHAELLSADVYYDQENYAEAAAAYIVFRDFHSKYKNMSYVVWKIGESFHKQLPSTFDRDLSTGFEAKKYFKIIVRDYPKSEYVEKAKKRILETENLSIKKERYIADFYYKTEDYTSARFHYIGLVGKFLNKDLIGHSMVRVLGASAHLNERDSCTHYYHIYNSKVPKEYKSSFEREFKRCQSIKPI